LDANSYIRKDKCGSKTGSWIIHRNYLAEEWAIANK
jgi:hypothetical protein